MRKFCISLGVSNLFKGFIFFGILLLNTPAAQAAKFSRFLSYCANLLSGSSEKSDDTPVTSPVSPAAPQPPAPPQVLFQNPVAQRIAEAHKWTNETVLYRYTKKKYLIPDGNGGYVFKPNSKTDATIRDVYQSGSPRKELRDMGGVPALNVSSAQGFYKVVPLKDEEVVIAMKLSDVIAEGAMPYPDVGTSIAEAVVFIFPQAESPVPVKIYRTANEKP
jgi:hypothetical protein